MNNNRKILLTILGIVVFLSIVLSITYAFFSSNANTSNNISYNVSFEEGDYNFTVTLNNVSNPGGTMSISSEDMYYSGNNTVAGSYSNALDISFVNNSSSIAKCTYDYIWVWDNTLDSYTISSGATKEYTVTNFEISEVQVPNYNASSFVIGSSYIMANANSSSTKTEPFTVKMYNLADVNQQTHKGKNYRGYLTIAHVNCGSETTYTLADYISYLAPRSGTDAVSNSSWILTEDHPNEWRYAGKNPDNYIQFNGELWRIIGVMPNMTYCTGEYGNSNECNTTGAGRLVKIIRNQTISSNNMIWDSKGSGVGSSITLNGSNDWSDSQLMLMLNGTNYLKTGYDVNNTQLHTSYTITSNIVAGNGYNFYNATYSYLDGSGTTVYRPSQANTSGYNATSGTLNKKIESSALSKIATVRWDLYGTYSYTTEAYNRERNINGLGVVYTDASLPENRAVYWYGKIGLMYPSDYGYATNGGNTYNRATCLGYQMSGWSSGDYKTDCALNNYLLFTNITSTAPGTSGTAQWTLSPSSGNESFVCLVYSTGSVNSNDASIAYGVRPVLYLKADTGFSGGNGTYNSPYTIL